MNHLVGVDHSTTSFHSMRETRFNFLRGTQPQESKAGTNFLPWLL
ncbi:MAG: hypothetical protein ACI9W6_001904 [Motiliproteus sp.]|jgi:hypothetical protein